MPAVFVFGRRWACGTDDFVFPGVLDTIVKSCWFVSALLTCIHRNIEEFEYNQQFLIYISGMIAFLSIIIVTDGVAVYSSARGSIMESRVRSSIPTLIYFRLFLEALDTGWNTLGTYWVFGSTFVNLKSQDPSSFYFCQRYIICNWVSLIILALFFLFLYDPLGSTDYGSVKSQDKAQAEFWSSKLSKYWTLFNMRSQTDNEVQIFNAVGSSMASLFGRTDFTSSDGIAGMLALFRYEEDRCSGVEAISSISPANHVDIKSTPSSILDVLKFQKYFPYTTDPKNWARRLLTPHRHRYLKWFVQAKRFCGLGTSLSKDLYDENGVCRLCKFSKLFKTMAECGILKTNLVHISVMQTYDDVPFCVFVDDKLQSIIVVLTVPKYFLPYLDFSPVPLIAPGLPTNLKVHGGLCRMSEKVKKKVQDVVEIQHKLFPTYNLVILGQSFGAGLAALLGISLYPKFCQVRVICLNPPGSLICTEGAKFSETFVTSITYGNDIFARFDVTSAQNLRKRVIEILDSCKTPKYKLLIGVPLRLAGYKLSVKLDTASKLQDVNCYENKAYRIDDGSADVSTKEKPSKDVQNFEREGMDAVRMVIPGRIIFVGNSETRNKNDIEVLDGTATKFSEVNLLPGVIDDHFKNPREVLETCTKRTH